MKPLIDRPRIATDEAYRDAMRLRCQTDLLFLAHVLEYTKISEEVHGPAIALCVKKDPGVSIEELYRYERKKGFLHLDPRGCFKSTLSICDTVQWIICYPEIRICKLTATKPLAAAIVGEISDHFVKGKGAEPTDFQALFPEFCIPKKVEGEYTAPCRKRKWREATVMAFSIETSMSGWHFDIMDPDDVVNTQNAATPPSIETVKSNWRTNKKCLMPGGFIHYKGTRYNPFDLWGDLIDKADPKVLKVLVRPALKINADSQYAKQHGLRLVNGEFPEENELEILFPELFGGGDPAQAYAFLKKEFEDDFESFMCQYMNDAQGGNDVTFTKEALLAATVPHAAVPVSGEIFIAWRLACKSKNWNNVAAAVGLLESGRLYVIDIVHGVFKPSTLANRVAKLAKKHGARAVTIEETPGAGQMESAIQNYALTLGWPLTINWLEFQEDDGGRDVRIKVAEPLVAATRLLFDDSIKHLNELYKQMANYGMMEETEIPDVVARLAERLPKSIAVQDLDGEQEAAWELAKQRDMYDRTHGLGQYAPAEPIEIDIPHEAQGNTYGFEADIMPGLNG